MMTPSQSAIAVVELRPTLALASINPGKIAEFQSLLGDRVTVASLIDLGLESPPETGATFEDNAALKAQVVFEQTGFVTLADDSGLEVDALDGLPGVRSARYAGDHHDDADNRALLLRNLSDVPDGSRTARFVAILAIIDASGSLSLTRGTCEGHIARSERGCNGFGYDPIFAFADGRTMAELDATAKNDVSHRGQAVRLALPGLLRALGLGNSEVSVPAP